MTCQRITILAKGRLIEPNKGVFSARRYALEKVHTRGESREPGYDSSFFALRIFHISHCWRIWRNHQRCTVIWSFLSVEEDVRLSELEHLKVIRYIEINVPNF